MLNPLHQQAAPPPQSAGASSSGVPAAVQRTVNNNTNSPGITLSQPPKGKRGALKLYRSRSNTDSDLNPALPTSALSTGPSALWRKSILEADDLIPSHSYTEQLLNDSEHDDRLPSSVTTGIWANERRRRHQTPRQHMQHQLPSSNGGGCGRPSVAGGADSARLVAPTTTTHSNGYDSRSPRAKHASSKSKHGSKVAFVDTDMHDGGYGTASTQSYLLSPHLNHDDPTSIKFIPFRPRLQELFAQIDDEFDRLIQENNALRSKLAAVADKLPEGELANFVDFSTELNAAKTVSTKKASYMGQKLKTAFRVPPGRLLSNVKANVASSVTGGNDSLKVHRVHTFMGHRDGIWDVDTFSTGCSWVGSASVDQSARIWCVDSGACLAHYIGHVNSSVNCIRFSPVVNALQENVLVLTGSGDQTAHIWKVPANVSAMNANANVRKSSEDEAEGVGTPHNERDDINDETVEQQQSNPSLVIRNAKLKLTGHMGPVGGVDWMEQGRQVVTGSWDKHVRVYDAETGKIIFDTEYHTLEIIHVCAYPTQPLVLTSSKDATFKFIDFRDGRTSIMTFAGHEDAVTSAVFTRPDRVISGSDDRTVKIWDLKNMRSPMVTVRLDSAVNKLAISSKHNVIAIPHDNRQVRLYDMNGQRIARLPRSNRKGFSHTRMVNAVAWADEGSKANLFTCGFDKLLIGWKYTPLHPKD